MLFYRKGERIVTGFARYVARYECTFHADSSSAVVRTRRYVIMGNYGGGASAAPVTGSTYRSRDSLANARSDYRGELIATDREMHWWRCGAQLFIVAFLLR